jgi:hypothetical protein
MTDVDCEFLSGTALSERIRLVCSRGDIAAAVAFWGVQAKEELFPDWESRKIEIVCDISMGCNSRLCLTKLGAPNNANLRVLDGLHAKVFWSKEGAVVGSANASANGVGFAGAAARNLEAGVYYSAGSDGWAAAGKFVRKCLKEAPIVDELQLSRSPEIAREPAPRIGPEGLASPSILQRVVADPARFEGTLFVVTGSKIDRAELMRLDDQRDDDVANNIFEAANRSIVLQDQPEVLRRTNSRVIMVWFGNGKPELQGYVNIVPVPASTVESLYGVQDWRAVWKELEMPAPKKAAALMQDLEHLRMLCPDANAGKDGWVGNAHELAAALSEINFVPRALSNEKEGRDGHISMSRQQPASASTRYEAAVRPNSEAGYPQRIPMWDAVERLGGANRAELLTELRRVGYNRPGGAALNEAYCRIELTDMTRRGFLRRVSK